MKTSDLIRDLRRSKLVAECPDTGDEFKLSEALLFDGTKPFPEEAIEKQKELIQELKDREADLKKRRKLATEKAEITTKSVNIGKNFEKVLPTLKDFKWSLPDCRFLGDPIDMITFNGLSNSKIDSVSFIEVKTGGARLNAHQKAVRDAIADHKVKYKVFR